MANIRKQNSHFPGVYVIINKTKRKCYIGQADDAQNRLSSHQSKLTKGKHEIIEMQKDYNSGNVFTSKILAKTEKTNSFVGKYERRTIEQYYIRCMEELEIPLYNRDKYSNQSFFWYAVRTDKDIMKLREEILFNKH